jgi:hypothetical protein
MTPLGLKQGAHYDQLLLNGNNVALVCARRAPVVRRLTPRVWAQISIGAKPTA